MVCILFFSIELWIPVAVVAIFLYFYYQNARLAQSVERKTLNLVVVGSSPTVGDHFFFPFFSLFFPFLL
jgi:hypothetical protein